MKPLAYLHRALCAALALCAGLLAGCGQTGPLYLPPKPAPAPAATPPATGAPPAPAAVTPPESTRRNPPPAEPPAPVSR